MAAPVPLSVIVERESNSTLPVQLAVQVRDRIRSGVLRPGDRLPSSRALAAELGIARAVVEQAFQQLDAEGWLTAHRGSGTFVRSLDALPAGFGPAPRAAGESGPSRPRHAAAPVSFDTGTPWSVPRHDPGWRRAWRDVSAAVPPTGYPDPAGEMDLREEVAAYVGRHRGIACSADEVMITSGTTHGLALLLETLPPGAVAVEDPGYRAAVQVAVAAGRPVVDVPVDVEGIDVAALRRSVAEVAAVYVTPAHQHPLGMPMSAARRLALLAEAQRRGAVVAEDDYDSQFRYDVAPLPALASLSRDVVYLGTAAKIVSPGLRLGWLVAPAELVRELRERRAARHDHPSWPVQRAFVTLLREGHVDRWVRAARRAYSDRSARVRRRLGQYLDVGGPGAGMYLTLRLDGPLAEGLVTAAADAGMELPSLASYGRTYSEPGIVLGFGGVSDRDLDRLLDVLEDLLRRTAAGGLRPADAVTQ